jgi:Icc protein
MRIAQITDTHIGPQPGPFDGFDVRANLLRVLAEIERANVDLLVISGDLAAEQGEPPAYRWIAEQLETWPTDVLILAGNHDDPAAMVASLALESALEGADLVSVRESPDAVVYGLDTSSAHLSEPQLEWLGRMIDEDERLPIVFMHHPPLDCGCRFMDSHDPLLDREHVFGRLREIGVRHVFSGHYHTYTVVEREGVRVVVCPSTMMQISRESEGFAVEHDRPGYLVIDVEGGAVRSEVQFLNGS